MRGGIDKSKSAIRGAASAAHDGATSALDGAASALDGAASALDDYLALKVTSAGLRRSSSFVTTIAIAPTVVVSSPRLGARERALGDRGPRTADD